MIVLDHFHVKKYLNDAVDVVMLNTFLLKIHQHRGLLNPKLST